MAQQPQKIDSEVIRQGLMSIKNSQIELLNELKNQTQQLKKTPARYNTSTEDSRTDLQVKMENIFSFPPENAESIVRYTPPSPSPVDKPYSFGVTNQSQLQSEVARHKQQNKMLNETLQKLIYSRSLDKQRVRELQSYLYFNSKILYQTISQILGGTPIGEIKRAFQNDLRINQDIYLKYQESNHNQILELLRDKEKEPKSLSVGPVQAPREPQSARQLGELKQQLILLMKTNQKTESNPIFGAENPKLREENNVLSKKCEQQLIKIAQLESDNKELARCWQRQIHQRKSVLSELEKEKKDKASAEVEKQFSFMQTDLESQLTQANERLRQKQIAEGNNHERLRKLADTVSLLREENQKLKTEIKSVNELRTVIKQQNLEASRMRESQLMSKVNQQGSMLQHFEQENHDLKNHLADMRRKFQVMAQMQARQRETDLANHELQLRKMQTLKTNSTVEHLWQVKRVEYDNINELLLELKDKNIRN